MRRSEGGSGVTLSNIVHLRGSSMSELFCVKIVVLVAMMLTPDLVEVAVSLAKADETAARIIRMRMTPSPVYDHYPEPSQQRLSMM